MTRLVLLIAMVSTAAAQPQPSAQTVLANVQKFYAGAKQMTAQFRQEVTDATFAGTQKSTGKVLVLKPSDLRFDYDQTKPGPMPEKTFVYDGSTMWFLDHKNKKIYQYKVQNPVLPAAISFLTGTGSLASQFNLALDTSGKRGAAGMTVLALTPKQPSAQYKQLFFVVDPKDWHITESIVINVNGDTNDFHFYSPDLQTPIAAQLFRVDPKSLPLYEVEQPNGAPPAKPGPAPAKPAAKP